MPDLVTSTSPPHTGSSRANPRHYVLSSENTSVCIYERGGQSLFLRLRICFKKFQKRVNQMCGTVLICTFNKPMFLTHTQDDYVERALKNPNSRSLVNVEPWPALLSQGHPPLTFYPVSGPDAS